MASTKSTKSTSVSLPKTPEDKAKALTTCLSMIEKQFGKGTIMRLGENKTMDVETISTGSLALDIGVLRPFQRKVQCEPTALYL